MMRIGVEAHHHRVGNKIGEFIIPPVRLENRIINSRQQILLKAPNGLSRLQDRLLDSIGVKFYQRAIALLHFDNSILNSHGPQCITIDPTLSCPNSIKRRNEKAESNRRQPRERRDKVMCFLILSLCSKFDVQRSTL